VLTAGTAVRLHRPAGHGLGRSFGRDEVLHALQQDEKRRRSAPSHQRNSRRSTQRLGGLRRRDDIGSGVAVQRRRGAKTIASDTSELNAIPVMVSMRMPASSEPALVVVYLACTELLKPLTMRIRHRDEQLASAIALALVMLLGVTYWRWLGYV